MDTEIIIENLAADVSVQELTDLLATHVTVEKLSIAVNGVTADGTQVAFAAVECGKHGREALLALQDQPFHDLPLKLKVGKHSSVPSKRTSFSGSVMPGRPAGRAGHLGSKSTQATRKSGGRGR